MAILENRFKTYNKRSSYKSSKSILPNMRILLNLGILFLSFLVIINPSILSINSHLASLNGATYTKVINPAKELISNSFNFVINAVNLKSLHIENIRLKLENARLKNNITSTETIKLQNISLAKALNFAKDDSDNKPMLKAKIVFQASSDTGGLAVIAAGENHGIKPNNLVLVNGYLSGRIITIGKNYSKVALVNSYNSRIPVKTSDTDLHAILIGGSASGAHLLHLHGSRTPVEGEVIVTSGNGNFYPNGIPVAKVTKVTEKTVTVSVLSDLSTVDFVEILNPDNFDN